MAKIQFHVRGHSLLEVGNRLAEQVADRFVPETSDPLRYHGDRIGEGSFKLRHYEWMPTRGGRTRARFSLSVDLASGSDGSIAVSVHLDERNSLILGAVCGSLPMVIAAAVVIKDLAYGTAAQATNLVHGLPIILCILLPIALGTVWLVHWSSVRQLEAERVFLERFLGASN